MMKSAKKFLALTLAMTHLLTFSASANAQVLNFQDGSTNQIDQINVSENEQLTINIINELGEVCPSCRAILETGSFLNNGAIDIWGILAIIAPTIINNGVITVQGDLLLSNLGINKEQFFAGIAELAKDPGLANGYILNQGQITNLTEGLIALVAANGGVHNLGTISSNGGAVLLTAGDRVSFPLTRDGVLNIGLDGLTGVKGQVFDKDGNLIDTNGVITNSGVLQANGGAVVLQAAGAEAIYDSIINHTGIVEAKSIAQENGKIILKSQTGNITVTDATLDASGYDAGEKGGSIEILSAGNVIVEGSSVLDASGDIGGGSILIGSDIGVTGPITATNVFVGSDVEVKADAVTNGNGGKIIVGAEEVALVYGSFSARGGAQGGNGGFIETSGKEFLDVEGSRIDASASNGEAGTWLLDPVNVNVVSSSTGNTTVNNIVNASGTTTFTSSITGVNHRTNVLASTIVGLLEAGTNVKLVTGSGAGDGNISILADISVSSVSALVATLTLEAAGSITVSAAIGASAGFLLNVIMTAVQDININDEVRTNGGDLTVTAGDRLNSSGVIVTSGGNINFTANGEDAGIGIDIIDEGLSAGTGSVSLNATSGDVKLSSSIVTDGSGTITVSSSRDIVLDNSSSDITSGGGDITFTADSDANGTGVFNQSNSGSVITTFNASGSGDVTITANDVALNGIINADDGTVFLKNSTAGKTFGLGSAAGDISISSFEASRVWADTLEIGTATAGNIQAAGFDSAPTYVVLRTGNDVLGAGVGTDINVSNLAIHAGGEVNLDTDVGTVAVDAVGAVVLNEASSLTVGAVKGLSGITTADNNIEITITSFGGSLDLEQSLNAGTDDVTLNSGYEINQTGGTITADSLSFTAEDFVTLAQAGNSWNTITGTTAGGAINVADSATNTTIQNLQTVGADITYNHTGAGDVTVTGTVSSGDGVTNGGHIEINSSNALTIASTAVLSSAIGTGGVFSAGAAVVESGSTIAVGAGNITLGGGATVLDTIINTPIIGAGAVILTALRDVIVSAEVTGPATTDMIITADSDLDGDGGVWLKSGADVNSDASLTITGSKINDVGANGESVRIDAGATVDAVGDITIQKSTAAPPTADIVVNGVVTTSGTGKTITVDSADELITSVDGTANLVGDNIDLTAVNDIDVEIDADNLFLETTTGNISVEDTLGGFSLQGFTNPGSGTLTLITHSPMTIAVDLIQAATINLSAGESVDTDDHLIIDDNVTVQSTAGDVNLSAGDNVNVNTGALVKSDTGAVTITAANGDTDDIGSVNLAGNVQAAATLTLNALTASGLVGLISQTAGALTAVDLVVSADDSATLNQAANNVAALAATTGGTVTYQDADGLDLKASTIGGAFNLTTNGAITDSGDLSVTGATTLAAGAANDITLDNLGNNFSTVKVTSGKDVTLNDAGAINLDSSSISGFLTVTAGGLIDFIGNAATTIGGALNLTTTSGGIDDSGTGSLAVTGTTTLDAGAANNITLDNAGNNFATVVITAGNDVTLSDANALDLGASAVSGTLDVATGGNLTDSGDVIAASLKFVSGAGVILDSANNDFGTVAGTADDAVVINDVNSLSVGSVNGTDGITTTDDNIEITSGGDITLDKTVDAGLGDATLTATGFIREGASDDGAPVADVRGKEITLNSQVAAPGDAIGQSPSYLDIEITDTVNGKWNVSVPNSGNIFINCIGDCPVGQIDIGTGIFFFKGNLVDGNDTVNGIFDGVTPTGWGAADWNIRAGGVHLEGGDKLGEVGNWIEMELKDPMGVVGDGLLMASTTDPAATGIFLANAGTAGNGLQIGGISGATLVNGLETAGAIVINSFSPLTVAANVSAAGNISLHANGASNADKFDLLNGISVSSTGAGNILITSGDQARFRNNSVVQTTGAGSVTIAAGEDFTDLTLDNDGNATANIRMDGSSLIQSADGDISLTATRHILLGQVNANSNSDAAAGNVTITADNKPAPNGVGRIEDNNGSTVNVVGNLLTLSAGSGIGVDGTNAVDAIETSVDSLNLTNTTTGHVAVTEIAAGGNLDIVSADQQGSGDMTIATENGRLRVTAGGSGAHATSGETLLSATGGDLVIRNNVSSTSGKINLDSTTRDVAIVGSGNVTSTSGEVEVNAQRHLYMEDGTFVNAGTGLIDVDALTGNATIASLQTTNATNDAVNINTPSGAVIDGGDSATDIIANSGRVNIAAANGVGSADAIETEIKELDATNTTSGDIRVRELAAGGNLDLIRVLQQALSGQVNIRTLNGTLTVVAAGLGGLGVSAIDGATRLFAQDSDASVTDHLVINNTVRSADGKINLDSDNDVIASDDGDVTAGDVTLKAGATGAEIEANAGRDIVMSNGTVFNANGGGAQGGIDFDAGRDVTLGSVQTTSALSVDVNNDAFNAVQIDAGGAVIDGGDAADDIIANNGQTTINAVNGIGHGNQLDVQLQSLRATNTTANDIRVREMNAGGDLNLVGVDQQAVNGDLNIRTQNGSLTVLAATVLLSGFTGGISAVDGVTRLFARDSDNSGADHLFINNTVTSNNGKINLDSENDVRFAVEGDVTSVTGEIEVDAKDDVLMSDNLGVDGTVLNAGSGRIDIDAGGNVVLTSAQTTRNGAEAVVIVAGGSIIDGGDTDVDIRTGTNGGMILAAGTGIGSIGSANPTNVNPNNIANNFATDALDTQGGRLAALTLEGDIQISNTGALNITTLTDTDGGTPMGNPGAGTVVGVQIQDASIDNSIIFIVTHSPMTISSQVTNFDGGNISLYALGSSVLDTMTVNANVQSLNGNGDLRLVAGGDMTLGAGVNVGTQGDGVTSGTGRVAMGAGYDATGKTADASIDVNPIFAADVLPGLNATSLASPSTGPAAASLFGTGTPTNTAANLTMDETSSVSTEGGRITIDAQNNFTVGRVDADGNASANGITDGIRGNILAFARNGSILDAEGPGEIGNLDFLANSLTMLAAGTIGLPSNHIEGAAPFLNTFSIGSQFIDIVGDTQVEMNSANGDIFLTATGTILLGHMSAPSGEIHATAGSDILSQGGGETRVTAFNLIALIAGGIVGTTSNPIHTHLNATPAQINLSAGGQAGNGVSAAIFSNVSPLALNMLNNPPGLVLFNGAPVAGQPLAGLIGSQSSLYYKAFVRGLRQYSDFDGNYAADFPGFTNFENFTFSPDLTVDTSAIDQVPLRGLVRLPRVVPIPTPARPTPVQPEATQTAENVLEQEPTPPAVVPIPASAVATDTTTDEGVPETPAVAS